MSLDRYPILVRDWTGDMALTIACHACDAERVIDVDEIYNEDIYECPADTQRRRAAVEDGGTTRRCGGLASMKYTVADECPACKALGFFDPDVNAGCCSRRCMLQAEYAETLKEAA